LEESITKPEGNWVELYRYVFPPDLKHPTLAIIGCVQTTDASPLPVAEMQARWATRLFKVSCETLTSRACAYTPWKSAPSFVRLKVTDPNRPSLDCSHIGEPISSRQPMFHDFTWIRGNGWSSLFRRCARHLATKHHFAADLNQCLWSQVFQADERRR
jgi:hypothetical protein